MMHCCSQCNFTAQFESALVMHHQLHHEKSAEDKLLETNIGRDVNAEKSKTPPGGMSSSTTFSINKSNKGMKLPNHTSSATRLFDKLRARISRSRIMISHPEELADTTFNDLAAHDALVDVSSDCSSKGLNKDMSQTSAIVLPQEVKETFSCHLCNFDANRITVLDRHLLNDHKISLEDLLKLVMLKTKEGLSEQSTSIVSGIRQPYYKLSTEALQEEEFFIETVAPKIKILKHASTNTDLQWTDIPNLKDNCRMISNELEKMMSHPSERCDQEDFLVKMQTLNECMCKFMDTSNTLKRTLTKEFGSKNSIRERLSLEQPYFELSLGDCDSPRDRERAHSEKMVKNKNKYGDNSRGNKKLVAESFYF